MRDINLIVIHCSATPNGKAVRVETIDALHKARGFKRDLTAFGKNLPRLRHIGYHYFIYASGPVTVGRLEREVGAHAAGFNANSIGICMAGTSAFSAAQWISLRRLVDGLIQRYPNARVVGHRDLSPDRDGDGIVEPFEYLKICPGFDVAAWRANNMQPPAEHVWSSTP